MITKFILFSLLGWCGNEIVRFPIKFKNPTDPPPGEPYPIEEVIRKIADLLWRNPKPDPNSILLGVGTGLVVGYAMDWGLQGSDDIAAAGLASFASSVITTRLVKALGLMN